MKVKSRLRLVSIEGEKTTFGDGDSQWADDRSKKAGNCYHDEITALYQNYNETLVRYLTIRLRSRQDAVEVAQEAYIRLLRRDNLEDIDCFQSFLFRTATNISIDLQRQRTRLAKNFTKSKILFGNIDEITPERELDARQTLDELRKALDELPPKCKQAFMLYKFKNMSHTEIAEKMDLSVSSIRKYIARGLAFCMQKMDE